MLKSFAKISSKNLSKFNYFKFDKKYLSQNESNIVMSNQTENEKSNSFEYSLDIQKSDSLKRRYHLIKSDLDETNNTLDKENVLKIIKSISKSFSDWLTERILQGKGENFKFEDLPQEIQRAVNFNQNKINQYEKLYSPESPLQFESLQKILKEKGFITESDLEKIENTERYEYLHKDIYEDSVEAINNLILYARSHNLKDKIVTLQLILNLDFDREDHLIKANLNLPKKFGDRVKYCVVTSKDLFETSINSGAQFAVDFEEFLDLIKDKNNIQFNKLISTEEQYVNLNDIEEELLELGFEAPNKEKGTSIKNADDLVNLIKMSKSDEVSIHPIKHESLFSDSSHFDKILEIDVGDLNMSKEDLLENIKSVLSKVNEIKPESIKGKYILTGFLIVGQEGFRINGNSLNIEKKSNLNLKKDYTKLI